MAHYETGIQFGGVKPVRSFPDIFFLSQTLIKKSRFVGFHNTRKINQAFTLRENPRSEYDNYLKLKPESTEKANRLVVSGLIKLKELK